MRASPLGGGPQRPRSPSRDRDVEVLDERRKKRSDVLLRATDLGERNENEYSGRRRQGSAIGSVPSGALVREYLEAYPNSSTNLALDAMVAKVSSATSCPRAIDRTPTRHLAVISNRAEAALPVSSVVRTSAVCSLFRARDLFLLRAIDRMP